MNKCDTKVKEYLEQNTDNKSVYLTVRFKQEVFNEQLTSLRKQGLVNYFKDFDTAVCHSNKEQILSLNNNEFVSDISWNYFNK